MNKAHINRDGDPIGDNRTAIMLAKESAARKNTAKGNSEKILDYYRDGQSKRREDIGGLGNGI